MESVFFGKPAPDLARQIDLCWCATSTGGSGRAFYEIPPAGNSNLIFRFSPSRCRMTLLGPRTETASVEIDEEADYFCISFRPGQAMRIVDAHPAELIDTFVEIPKLCGERVDSLADRLHSLSPASRQAVMEGLVRGAAPLVRDERCREAASLLAFHRGGLKVKDLAAEVGLHVRSLERLFLDHLGMTPKQQARLVRLGALSAALRSGGYTSLADLAHSFGYTDQSHMIRDFKELTGRLPGEKGAGDMRWVAGPPRTRIVHRYRP
ncbi:MAG: helix-turn-helix transcriptional regulator [Geobacter sp.]|nr:helix-turn-helix transcriptional regulator [Geobacter sp.]